MSSAVPFIVGTPGKSGLLVVPEGGSVQLHAALSQREIIITVSDTGVGITAEHLPFIFDRFYKVDSARAAAGSGLGLSIAKAIVEQHGGAISVVSQPDVETIFTITLPADTGTAPLNVSAWTTT